MCSFLFKIMRIQQGGITLYNKDTEIPQYIIDGIARMLLPEIQKFYESDEGKELFEKWKEEQEKQ